MAREELPGVSVDLPRAHVIVVVVVPQLAELDGKPALGESVASCANAREREKDVARPDDQEDRRLAGRVLENGVVLAFERARVRSGRREVLGLERRDLESEDRACRMPEEVDAPAVDRDLAPRLLD